MMKLRLTVSLLLSILAISLLITSMPNRKVRVVHYAAPDYLLKEDIAQDERHKLHEASNNDHESELSDILALEKQQKEQEMREQEEKKKKMEETRRKNKEKAEARKKLQEEEKQKQEKAEAQTSRKDWGLWSRIMSLTWA